VRPHPFRTPASSLVSIFTNFNERISFLRKKIVEIFYLIRGHCFNCLRCSFEIMASGRSESQLIPQSTQCGYLVHLGVVAKSSLGRLYVSPPQGIVALRSVKSLMLPIHDRLPVLAAALMKISYAGVLARVPEDIGEIIDGLITSE